MLGMMSEMKEHDASSRHHRGWEASGNQRRDREDRIDTVGINTV
jgi:hypothetical protein